MSERGRKVGFVGRASMVIVSATLLLTASFLGILATINREIAGVQSRIPWYLLIAGLAFVTTIVLLEDYGATGREIIVTSTVVGILGFIVGSLSVEGVIFTIRFPEDVFVSRLVLYFLAAGLIGTGVAYWALRHWREFTGKEPQRL